MIKELNVTDGDMSLIWQYENTENQKKNKY